MPDAIVYIHGRSGSPEEAAHYRGLFPDCAVIGMDYTAQSPWEAAEEFPRWWQVNCQGCHAVAVIANSIGAYYAMMGLSEQSIEKAFFISPVADMEKLITDTMRHSGVTEEELRAQREMTVAADGRNETLSLEYLCYVREHPVTWHIPTHILYGGRDQLTPQETMSAFAAKIGATLTVMEQGEHWFHTDEQMAFLDRWITSLF
ncbi:MAG: alpha/beta hydrolase [Clostridia bacterium]|nr:alpha/beta hydrolase [Clostridia bacterium]